MFTKATGTVWAESSKQGETSEEGIQPEVLEELGFIISHPRLHGLLMFPNFKGSDWYVLVFMTGEFSGG